MVGRYLHVRSGVLACFSAGLFILASMSPRTVRAASNQAAVSSTSYHLRSVGLWLGGRLTSRSMPAVSDSVDEVYAPALDAINGTFGSSLVYQPDQSRIIGRAADGRPVLIQVAGSPQAGMADHNAFVVDGQVYVPLHALSRMIGSSFEWNPGPGHVSMMPQLTSVSVVPQTHGIRVELHSTAPMGFVKVSYYDSPWRIVLDVNGARTWPGVQKSVMPGLSQVRWKEYPSPGKVRIVIELTSQLTFHIADSGRPNDYWLDIDSQARSGFPAPAPGSDDPESGTAVQVGGTPAPSAPAVAVGGATSSTAMNSHISRATIAPLPAAVLDRAGTLPPAAVDVIPVANATGPDGSAATGASGTDASAAAGAAIASGDVASILGIQSKRVDARTTEVTIHATGPIDCHPSFYDSPSRLVLDIPHSTLSLSASDPALNGPGVTQVRTGAFPRGTSNSRVVLDLTSRSLFRVWSEQDRSLVRVLVQEMQPDGQGGLTGSPVAGHVICIDPGHSDIYHGARGLFGLKEEDVTLDVALRLEQLLTAAGAQVIMTRRDHGAPDGAIGLTSDLIYRAMKANRAHAEIFLSIHCNAMPDGEHGSVRGSQTIYSRPESVQWANTVYHSLTNTLGHGGDGLHYRPRIKVTEYTDMPATLAELGFLDNRSDAMLLVDPEFRQREAEGLFHAFEVYFSRGGSPLQPPPGVPVPLDPAPLPAPGTDTPDTAGPGTFPGTVTASRPSPVQPGASEPDGAQSTSVPVVARPIASHDRSLQDH